MAEGEERGAGASRDGAAADAADDDTSVEQPTAGDAVSTHAEDDHSAPRGGTAVANKAPGTEAVVKSKLEELRKLNADDVSVTQEAKVAEVLASLETATWQALDPPSLNLQIILRRRYETAVGAARAATASAELVILSARSSLNAATWIAVLGWSVTFISVGVWTFRDKPLAFRDLAPALAATSGAVLLLVAVATLGFRFAQRTHERAMSHYEDAGNTRRLETAVRMLMLVPGNTEASHMNEFAMRLISRGAQPEARERPGDVSALPEGAMTAFEKVVDALADVSKELVGVVVKPKKSE